MRKGKGFSFNLTFEPSEHKVRFTYPENWSSLPKKDRKEIANEIAYEAGPYLAFYATTWHEILTWFGVHFIAIEQEFNSAFSWEDSYSNLLGTRLAVKALQDDDHSFDEAMTLAINREMKKLGGQSGKTAKQASENMRGKWFTGNFIVDTKMRNFDIGLDGYVTPTLVPGTPECGTEPVSIPVPNLEVLKKHGFTMTYEIKPNVLEQAKIFKVIEGKRVYPEKHYPVIMSSIKEKAVEKGYNFDE